MIADGKLNFMVSPNEKLFGYRRYTDTDEIIVWNNLSEETLSFDKEWSIKDWKYLNW